jgi:hypothetical protein
VPAAAQLVLVLGEGSAYNRLPSLPNAPVTIDAGALSFTTLR